VSVAPITSRKCSQTRGLGRPSPDTSDDVTHELTKLEQQPGKDVAILGSSGLTVSLLRMELVDEPPLLAR
jgi:dihydrofolate reductase